MVMERVKNRQLVLNLIGRKSSWKMKETYDYEVKAKLRGRLKSFVHMIYPKRKIRRNLRILTLLGHENLELNQVWDPLEIQRANITNVEGNKKAYDLSPKDRGVEEIYGDLEDVVQTIDGPFDIINLDMVSPFTLQQREILREIAGRQLLGEKGILVTAYLGQREGGYHKKWFLEMGKSYLKDYQDDGKVEGRSELMSRMVLSIMADGVTNRRRHPFFEGNKVYERFFNEEIKIDPTIPEKYRAGLVKLSHAHLSRRMLMGIIEDHVLPLHPDFAEQEGGKELFFYQKMGSYFSLAQKRYRYVGNNGSPMLIDMSFLKQLPLENIAELISDGNDILIKDNRNRHNINENKKLITQFIAARYRCFCELEPREFLGSSYKSKPREKPKEQLTKEGAIYLLKEGVPAEEILETYSSFTKMQLAALKAHLTIGTYEKD